MIDLDPCRDHHHSQDKQTNKHTQNRVYTGFPPPLPQVAWISRAVVTRYDVYWVGHMGGVIRSKTKKGVQWGDPLGSNSEGRAVIGSSGIVVYWNYWTHVEYNINELSSLIHVELRYIPAPAQIGSLLQIMNDEIARLICTVSDNMALQLHWNVITFKEASLTHSIRSNSYFLLLEIGTSIWLLYVNFFRGGFRGGGPGSGPPFWRRIYYMTLSFYCSYIWCQNTPKGI